MPELVLIAHPDDVAPHVGAWIEIGSGRAVRGPPRVAPHVGAWIEIRLVVSTPPPARPSHPTWVRGLKYGVARKPGPLRRVAPHVGAWIEISRSPSRCATCGVAPHVGAWIEIPQLGLGVGRVLVAPHVGAWIEIIIVRF